MKRKIIVIGIIILLTFVGLSGCNEKTTITQEPEDFAEQLPQINESIRISLANIYIYINNYDYYYRWSQLMNLAFITESMINDMQNLENEIKEEVNKIENALVDYYQLKNNANLSELTGSEKESMNDIEAKILDYHENLYNINSTLEVMARYTEFWDLTSVKQILLEDYGAIIDLMNQKDQNEGFEDLLQYPEQLIQLCWKLKDNDEQKNNLNIVTYSEDIINIWDIYTEAWELYEEYLNLLVVGRYGSAESKYTEYSQKNNEALEIEATQNLNEINNQMDQWYQKNIGEYLDLFEEYLV